MHRSLLARLGLPCGLVALVVACGAAQAEEGVAFKNLMGTIGILPPEKDPIHYRERAPLVLPPKAELPPPSASYASSNPQWPNDPDVAAKRRRLDEGRSPVTWSETRRMSENNPRMSPDELARGRTATNTQRTIPGSHRGDNARDVLLLSPEQMAARAPSDVEDQKAATGKEPARKTLAEPPTGYRRSATGGTVKADFAPRIDQQQRDASPMNWLARKFNGSEDDE